MEDQDVFDIDVRELAEPAEDKKNEGFASGLTGLPTLCSNQCTGDCCTIASCNC